MRPSIRIRGSREIRSISLSASSGSTPVFCGSLALLISIKIGMTRSIRAHSAVDRLCKTERIDRLDSIEETDCIAGLVALEMPNHLDTHRLGLSPKRFDVRSRFLDVVFCNCPDAGSHHREDLLGGPCLHGCDDCHMRRD